MNLVNLKANAEVEFKSKLEAARGDLDKKCDGLLKDDDAYDSDGAYESDSSLNAIIKAALEGRFTKKEKRLEASRDKKIKGESRGALERKTEYVLVIHNESSKLLDALN